MHFITEKVAYEYFTSEVGLKKYTEKVANHLQNINNTRCNNDDEFI
jgi:hypothetical protein